ncbi:MAG TPA: alpha/beta fold hydrolase [Cellulomonas sp.]
MAGGRALAWTRRSDALVVRMPRWGRVLLATVSVLVGAALALRPTTALGLLALLFGVALVLTGLLELVGGGGRAGAEAPPRWRLAAAVLWVLAGLVVLLWTGLTVRALAVVVAVALIANGLSSVGGAFRRGATADARATAALLGAAGTVLGLVALLWPDITLLAAAIALGVRMVLAGLLELWDVATGRPTDRRPAPPSRRRRWLRTTGAALAVVVALVLAGVSAAWHDPVAVVDDFYATPRTVPSEPGQLIRYEEFTRGVPDGATAWRILYTTTGADGSAAVASGLVVVPDDGSGDYPVIDWAHGTTGYARDCAPSLLTEPFESGALFLLPEIIENGWALVATDYIGLGAEGAHPYLVGDASAYATLDARRAAAQITEAQLGDQTVVWGHSQGGGAALWTGALAEEYAPDVPLSGVVALAPATNLPVLMDEMADMLGGSILEAFTIAAYIETYDDVTYANTVRTGAQVTVQEVAERCLSESSSYVSVLDALGMVTDPDLLVSDDDGTGAFQEHLAENVPPATISVPVLLGQGADDSVVDPAMQAAYVASVCAEGEQVDYRTYAGRDHVPLVQEDSPLVPQLIEWTAARFAGEPATDGCTQSSY